jgi:hypothetical protein
MVFDGFPEGPDLAPGFFLAELVQGLKGWFWVRFEINRSIPNRGHWYRGRNAVYGRRKSRRERDTSEAGHAPRQSQ